MIENKGGIEAERSIARHFSLSTFCPTFVINIVLFADFASV